jgi:Cu(I)/Ag(I) efflux system membrane protein CusA/SilA
VRTYAHLCGLKIQGPNLEGIQQVGAQVRQSLPPIPEMRSIFSERVSQEFYLNIEVNRRAGEQLAQAKTQLASWLYLQMVRRIRV